MGGSNEKDYIENLMGMCRKHHNMFENKEISKEDAQADHDFVLFLEKNLRSN